METPGRIVELDSYRHRKLLRSFRWLLRFGIILKRNFGRW